MKISRRISKGSISRQKSLRPTTGKVRESLFNILRYKIDNASFLDLYAGTGAVGIEALKNGASEVVFVETRKGCTKKINQLIKKFGFSEKANIIAKKVISFIEWAEVKQLSYNIIFLDPPYHTNEIVYALSALGKSQIVKHEGIVIAEHFVKKQLPERFGKLQKIRDYNYGDTVLSLYKEFN